VGASGKRSHHQPLVVPSLPPAYMYGYPTCMQVIYRVDHGVGRPLRSPFRRRPSSSRPLAPHTAFAPSTSTNTPAPPTRTPSLPRQQFLRHQCGHPRREPVLQGPRVCAQRRRKNREPGGGQSNLGGSAHRGARAGQGRRAAGCCGHQGVCAVEWAI